MVQGAHEHTSFKVRMDHILCWNCWPNCSSCSGHLNRFTSGNPIVDDLENHRASQRRANERAVGLRKLGRLFGATITRPADNYIGIPLLLLLKRNLSVLK